MGRVIVAPYAGWSSGDYAGFDEVYRLAKARSIAFEIDESVILLTSGVPPGCKRFHAEVLRDFLVEKTGWPAERVLLHPHGSNTVLDTIAIIEGTKESGDCSELILVSSPYHIVRIWLVWQISRLRGWASPDWKASFRASATSKNPWRSALREVFAVPKSVWEALTISKVVP